MIKKILLLLKTLWNSKFARSLLSVGSILLTSAILGWLVYAQWDVLKSQLINIRPYVLIFSFLVYSLILFLTSSTWAKIMNELGHKVSFGKHFITFCFSALGKRLPGTIWYIAWRANLYKEDGYASKLIVLSSGIEMVVTVISGVIVSLFFSVSLISKFNYSIIGLAIIIIATLIFLIPQVNQWIFLKLNVDFAKFSYTDLLIWTIGYIFIWILVGALLFSYANLFTTFEFSSLGYFIGATALTGVLSRLFLFLPSHFGFGEVSLSLLLVGIMPTSLAVIIALSNRILTTFFEIIWALISLVIKQGIGWNNPK